APVPPSSAQAGAGRAWTLVGLVAVLGIVGAVAFFRRGSPSEAAGAPVTSAPSVAPVVPPPPTCPDEMVRIPGGKFFMGADDGNADERPAHQVTLSPFCMDRKEVTVAD